MNNGNCFFCSDIHGMYGSYKEAMKYVKENDTMYVLGDVIDRGKNGIKILQDMSKRKNVQFLVGNHEDMMINCINILKKNNITTYDEVDMIIKCVNIIASRKNLILDISNEEKINRKDSYLEELKQKLAMFENKINEIRALINISEEDLDTIRNWIISNNGEKTLRDYMLLSTKEREEIYNYIMNAYLFQSLNVADRHLLLVHAVAPYSDEFAQMGKEKNAFYKYSFLKNSKKYKSTIDYVLWNRDDERGHSDYEKYSKQGYLTICGHTPDDKVVVNKEKGFMRIDTGCGHKKGELTVLGCNEKGEFFSKKIPQLEEEIDHNVPQ